MVTSTSQILDKIFREYTIIGTITFHGGDNSITYPWGAYSHTNDAITGDDVAFKEIAQLLQNFAGHNDKLGVEEYDIGTMHDVVYDVNGGFEDWAYGASWDRKNVPKSCNNSSIGNEEITYQEESNRAFVYLIEAGYDKTPKEETLGNELAIFKPFKKEAIWGHVSRNAHLSLKFAEYMNPSINIDSVKFDKGIFIKLRVIGCVKMTDVQVEKLNYLILKKNYEPNTGHHLVSLAVTEIQNYIPEIIIKA